VLLRVSRCGVDEIGKQMGIGTMNLELQPEARVGRDAGQVDRTRDSRLAPPAWRVLLWPALVAFVACCMGPYYLTLLRPPADRVNDFFQEWASARNYWGGMPIYTDHTVTLPLYLDLDPSNPKYSLIEVNAHPPTSVLLGLPLAFLGYQDAVLVWNLVSLGVFAVSLAMVWRGFRIPFSSRSLFRLLAALLVCGPLVMQVSYAQLNMVILLLLTGVWAADRSQKPLTAGALLGLASAIKLFPGFLFFYFIVRRQWKCLVAGVFTVALVTLLTAAVFGWEAFRDYWCDALPRVAKFRGHSSNASLVGFWIKLFDPPAAGDRVVPLLRSRELALSGIAVSYAVVIAVLGWTVRCARTRTERDIAFSLSLTAMLLVSPITWDHYLLLLLVPISVMWLCPPRTVGSRVAFGAILIAFWFPPWLLHVLFLVEGRSLGTAQPLHTFTILSYQFYALVALFILIAVEAARLHNRLNVNRIKE